LQPRNIRDERVLAAMMRIPRERFIPPDRAGGAYEDEALPIGWGQTISQPYMVAAMSELLALSPGDRVLEIGTGSGYQAAVLAELVKPAGEVFTIERLPELSDTARWVLHELGYDHVRFRVGDGSLGWAEFAPYNAVILTAGGPDVPPALIEQLAEGGRFVGPVGPPDVQTLVRWTRRGGEILKENLFDCRFVPLIGKEGWEE
jgi:protein-L-isoaspartate(D-aspartate) O-methyltransferase